MPIRALRRDDPRRLGRYELLGLLGEGGMGAVYQARDPDGRIVAVKVIRPEFAAVDEFRARFRSEVNRAREVPPFSTAAVLDADPDHHPPYLVVEYVDGPSLAEVVAEQGPLRGGALHSVAVGVATALAAIHGAGVVHRDLKPTNVLFALGSPKVIDFGIARALESTSEHTRTGQMVGTIAYMAPERLDGPDRPVTPAVDVFAWGAVVAYAGTGRNPFAAESSVGTAARILTAEPDLGGLADPLRAVVRRALAKDPADRPTASDLLDLLVTRPGTNGARPVPRTHPDRAAGRDTGRRRTAVAAGALVTAAAAAGLLLSAPWRPDRAPGATGSAAPVSSRPTSVAPSRKAGPVSDVRLVDKGDSVELSWKFAKGSKATVVIAGARAGKAPERFQELPAGATDYAVYGLQEDQNYCFTVASKDTADTAEKLCTRR
ncbi:serine/threonine-protein kinase [Actinoplanes octamycinicus]|uniref:serine/threonine-protein kinase n=1 Tax=Actinoplanes octamycinicus TaxID=135948 RepID=UPI0035EC9D28